MIRWRWFRDHDGCSQAWAYDRSYYVGWIVQINGYWYASPTGRCRRRCDAKRLVELDVLGGSLRDPGFEHPRRVSSHEQAHQRLRNAVRRARHRGGRRAARDVEQSRLKGWYASNVFSEEQVCSVQTRIEPTEYKLMLVSSKEVT